MPDTPPLSDDRELLLKCIKVNQNAEACKTEFIRRINDYFQDIEFYAFKDRIKGASAIQKKVLRKRAAGRSDYGPENITDAWGCRFVTLFQNDIVDICKHLVNFSNIWKSRLKYFKILDITIYDNRPESDPLSIGTRIEKLFKDAHLTSNDDVIRTTRDTGYSSVHITFETNITTDKRTHEREIEKEGASDIELARFEIQIRDVFEDGWSEIAHILYKEYDHQSDSNFNSDSNTLEDAKSKEFLYAQSEPHLNALKAVVDGCCQHANLIRQYLPGFNKRAPEGRNLSITHLDEDRDSILDGTVIEPERKDLVKAIAEAYELLNEAHNTTALSDLADARPFYIAAATKFDEAFKLANGRLSVPTKRLQKHDPANATPVSARQKEKTVEYHLRLERANSRMFSLPIKDAPFSSEEEDVFQLCLADYNWLLDNYPSSASIHLRVGQAYIRNRHSKERLAQAKSYLEKAGTLALYDKDIHKGHWIFCEIPIQLAHSYYYTAKLDPEGIQSNIQKAVNILENVIHECNFLAETDDYILSLLNKILSNIIYYNYVLIDKDTITNAFSWSVRDRSYPDKTKEKINSYIDLLLSNKLSKFSEHSVETIDSIILGALITGNWELAAQKADQNVRYLKAFAKSGTSEPLGAQSSGANLLNDRQKRMLWRAHSVMTMAANRFVENILSDQTRIPTKRERRWGGWMW